MGSIQLNAYLNEIGAMESSSCSCGEPYEDTLHYFFVCPKYNDIRINLHEIIIRLASFTLKTVLYGSDKCTFANNVKIFEAVHTYIAKSVTIGGLSCSTHLLSFLYCTVCLVYICVSIFVLEILMISTVYY